MSRCARATERLAAGDIPKDAAEPRGRRTTTEVATMSNTAIRGQEMLQWGRRMVTAVTHALATCRRVTYMLLQ